jgi:hypothetical protein
MANVMPASVDRTADAERVRRLFRLFGETQCRGVSVVYEALSEAIARDDRLLGLLLDTPGDQRRPSLLFAAVNFLLASDASADLAAYYPIHGGARAADDGLAPAFVAFCERHRDSLLRLLRERSTQTNEIRRCIALHVGLGYVARRWPGPLALVEVGASAGLNLRFDDYRYRLGGRDQTASGTANVVVSCDVRGDPAGDDLLNTAPTITRRLGIDQHPIDLTDPDARAWLEAFVWPEQVHDLATLRASIDLALASPLATLVQGEATADTARLIAELPGEAPVVVFTASLLSYLTAAARAAFVAQLDEVARHRPVAWVFAEGPGLLATIGLDIPVLTGPLRGDTTHYLIGASLRGPQPEDRLLALADPYVRWLAPAKGTDDDFQWVSG